VPHHPPDDLRYDTITFLSDYGTGDEFVGVVKSVIRSVAPAAAVVDLSHEIAPHDVRGGGLCLARAAQYLCPGVVLAVVDPGVGTERRAVAIEVGEGASVLVGPDNGLLAPAVALVGGASRVVELTNPAYQLAAPGLTFAGRDVFAPAAAYLCRGVPLDELGPGVDAAGLRPGTLPLTRIEGDRLHAEVLWVDRYGNAQLNVDPDELAGYGEAVALQVGGSTRVARRARTYAELRTGEIGLVVDSYGLVSVAVDRSSAADELRIAAGDPLSLAPLPDADARDAAADADTHTHQGADSGHDAGGAPGRVPDRRNGTATAVRLSSRPTGPRRA
jgi:S-adenosyl-L-methionine hydrolase (adenosine-forming)